MESLDSTASVTGKEIKNLYIKAVGIDLCNKKVESKHYGAVKESTSEQQRFDRTKITFSLRKNGGYIHSSLSGRSVLVVRQAGRRKSCCLQNPVTWLLICIFNVFGIERCTNRHMARFWRDYYYNIVFQAHFFERHRLSIPTIKYYHT